MGLAVVPFALTGWVLSRPPLTPYSEGMELVSALSSGDARRIMRDLLPEEQKALNLSEDQVERILKEVITPDFKALKVREKEMRIIDGPYEKYLRGPCGEGPTKGSFTLGILELTERKYQTSLTYLVLGLEQAEFVAAQRTGNLRGFHLSYRKRWVELRKRGMTSKYDYRDGSIAKIN